MTVHHSPWPLFGDDLELARAWLSTQLRGFVPLRTGHLAISLGMGDALVEGLQSGAMQTNAGALRQWRFRIARLHGESNPYRHLLKDGLFEHAQAAISHSQCTGIPLGVQLNGGIGDHLEALSLLLPWARAQQCCLDLMMGEERQQLIEPLLPPWDGIHCNKSRKQDAALIPVMALRAAVIDSTKYAHYRPWLQQKKGVQQSSQRWLCCWRAEGAGDKLSAHSRSVPWALVQEFYCDLQCLQPEVAIVDITRWKAWEAERLKAIGVTTLDPRQGTLLELAQRCRVSRVITIDTALVHLCAAAGLRADLLLSVFPDERWQELNRPEHHYGQLIKQWRSSQFGSWSAVLASLASPMIAASR